MCKNVIELQHLIMQKNYLNDTVITTDNIQDSNIHMADN